jgi:hypothetical protein
MSVMNLDKLKVMDDITFWTMCVFVTLLAGQ